MDTWRPVFASRDVDQSSINTYLQSSSHLKQWQWAAVQPPSYHQMESTIHRLGGKATKTGQDGLPYAAWPAAGPLGVRTLYDAMWYSLDGGLLHPDEYNVVTVLAPKDSTHIMDAGVACPPDE
eukprot:12425045-Karenia_brevis.AAC.1